MSMFLQFTAVGISMGMIYALMAMGLILLVRSVGVLNFAQGDLLMWGSYVSYMLVVQMKLPLFLTLLASLGIYLITGIVFMFTIWWPVRNSSWSQSTIVCTIGASYIIEEACRLIWGNVPMTMDSLVAGALGIGELKLNFQYIIIFVVCMLIMIGIFILYDKSYAGLAMQAATQDRQASVILGIPVIATIAVTYMLVAVVMGFSGFLVAPLFFVSQNLAAFQLKCFAGVIIGGFGNLRGAIIGSLIVGLIESYSAYFTSTYKDAFIFGVLLLVLAIRPQGLFGEQITEKA